MNIDPKTQMSANVFLDSWWENLTPKEQAAAGILIDYVVRIPAEHPLSRIIWNQIVELFPGFPVNEMIKLIDEQEKGV